MDPDSNGDQAAEPDETGWIAEHSVHRQLVRDEPAYRRRYLVLTCTPMVSVGLDMAIPFFTRHLGIPGAVSFSLLQLAVMGWLMVKSGLFMHRRITAVLRERDSVLPAS